MRIIEEYPYFFTATILEWKHLLKLDKFKDIIISSFEYSAIIHEIYSTNDVERIKKFSSRSINTF